MPMMFLKFDAAIGIFALVVLVSSIKPIIRVVVQSQTSQLCVERVFSGKVTMVSCCFSYIPFYVYRNICVDSGRLCCYCQ